MPDATPAKRAGRPHGLLVLVALVLAAGALTQWAQHSAGERLARYVAERARPGDIHMIASDSCVFCAQARDWFRQHRIAFSECSIERDAQCAAAFNALLAPGTPVFVVRSTKIVGFSPERIAGALQ